jgi:signal peptidase
MPGPGDGAPDDRDDHAERRGPDEPADPSAPEGGDSHDGDHPPRDAPDAPGTRPGADPPADADAPPEGDPARERPSTPGHRRDPPPPESGDDGGGGGVVETTLEVVRTAGTVLLVGLLLFGISGVWPPLVAVESGSMEPHMYKGDLVFIVENGRFAPANATDGVVTHRQGEGTGYWSFGDHGNVVVYTPHVAIGNPDGAGQVEYRAESNTPIIHRARFHVEEGENWVAMADERYLGRIDTCEEADRVSGASCPADHAGFVTKGDNNGVYDQVNSRSIVKQEWIRGVAKVRIPWLGCVRLELSGDSCF